MKLRYRYRRSARYQVESLESRVLLSGLTAQYFDRVDFTDLKLTRTDSFVNFSWGTNAPDPSMGADNFSVRWTGQVQPQFSQDYTFYIKSDDGARLWVDGRLIIDNWVNQSATEKSAVIPLIAGQDYDIRLDYYDATSNATAILSWSSPSQAKQVIPSARLFPSTTGLDVTFFDNADFTGASVARTDPTVDFNWGSGSPDPAIASTTYSARWTGEIVPQYSEGYSFYVTSDSAATVKLWVDRQAVIDSTSIQDSGQIKLEAGKRYDIQLDYSHSTGSANVKLEWSSPSQLRQDVPTARLYASKLGAIPTRKPNYTNSVNDLDRPDPGVIFADGYYWMTHTTGGPSTGWPLSKSTDMTGNWTFVKNLLDSSNKPAWMTGSFWAPEIHKINGQFVITGTTDSTTYGHLVIAIATAPEITGPYTVRATPIVDDTVKTLDSHIFQDFDGRVYLIWKRDSSATGGPANGSIRMRELDPADLTNFKAGSLEVTLLNNAGGGAWEKNIEEAPWMVHRGDYYYLFYSGSSIDTTYAEGVARATTILGPYTRYTGNVPILQSNSTWGGPGHGAFVQDVDGSFWFFYHARHQDDPSYGRVQMLDQVIWTADGWPTFGNGGTPSVAQQVGPRVDAASGSARYTFTGDANSTITNDTFTVTRDPADPSLVDVSLNGAVVLSTPFNQVENISLNAGLGDDTLVLDYAHGEAIPGSGINFTGGTNGSDTIRIIGAPWSDNAFHATATEITHGTGRITFNGVENLSLQSGVLNVDADLGGISLNATSTQSVILFHTAQTLAALTLSSGASASMDPNGSRVLRAQSISITGAARLDLNDNDLVVQSGDFSTIQALVFGGYRQSADPTATGIVSSTGQTAPGNPILALFDNALVHATAYPFGSGNTISANAVVGKYTYFGDTNLDGQVTADDYGALDANFGATSVNPGAAWIVGDTNFDGQVTADDYGTLDANFGAGSTNPLAAVSAGSPSNPLSLQSQLDLLE